MLCKSCRSCYLLRSRLTKTWSFLLYFYSQCTRMLHVCTHGYMYLHGLRQRQLSPFFTQILQPRQPPLLLGTCASPPSITLVAITRPILSVHISSEMLCLSTATCWPPACVCSLLLSEETPQYSVLQLLFHHEFAHVLSSYFIPLILHSPKLTRKRAGEEMV